MINKKSIYLFLVLACFVMSCSRVPNGILSEKKMRAVLYDMQIAEAMAETNHETYKTADERQTVYNAVFSKHNITEAEYDSSLIWYGKNMDLYMEIYKLVLKDVNTNITALGDIKPNPLSGEASAKDSIDVWILNRGFAFSPTRVFNALVFDINPEKPYSSGSSYVLGLSVWGISSRMKQKPFIRIYAMQADTVISVNKEITEDGYVEAVLKTVSTKQVNRIAGYIYMNDDNMFYRNIYLSDIQMMKYNFESKAVTAPQTDSVPSELDNADKIL